MDHPPASAARAFFKKHKDLFEYDKHVGNINPFEEKGTTTEKSFIDRYREIDHSQRSEPAVCELSFSLRHPPTAKYFPQHVSVILPTPALEFMTLQSTVKPFNSQFAEIQPHHQRPSPQHAIRHKQEFFQSSDLAAANNVSGSMTFDGQQPFKALRSPQRNHSPVKPQRKYSSVTQSSERGFNQGAFTMPKITELLIDRETRANFTSHKFVDEAHKIEILIGSKCVGRVSAVSRNIPSSIRTRLQVSANMSVRREKLYDLLRRDYDELNARYRQQTAYQ